MTNDDLIFRHRVRLFARASEIGVSGSWPGAGLPPVPVLPLEALGGAVWGGDPDAAGEAPAPGCPTNWHPGWSSRCWRWRWGARGWGRGGWRPIAPADVGWAGDLAERGVQGAPATRDRDQAEAAEPGGRVCVATRAGAAASGSRAAPGCAPARGSGAAGLLPHWPVDQDQGKVWQYTAIDAFSSYTWASVQVTPMDPSARYTSALVRQVARELSQAGWQLKAVSTDNGSEFRSQEFRGAVAKTGAEHRFIHAGRPQSNGCVERVQRTVPEE